MTAATTTRMAIRSPRESLGSVMRLPLSFHLHQLHIQSLPLSLRATNPLLAVPDHIPRTRLSGTLSGSSAGNGLAAFSDDRIRSKQHKPRFSSEHQPAQQSNDRNSCCPAFHLMHLRFAANAEDC